MNRIPVALFDERTKAEAIQRRLCGAGIAAELHDELRLEKLWFVSKEHANLRLEVPAKQFERTEQLLMDWDTSEGAMRDSIRCPECKSFRVDYPQFTRKSLLTNLAAGLAAEAGLVEKEYYCHDCHCTWPKDSKPHRHRPNMAPHYFIEGVHHEEPKEPHSEHHTHKAG